MAVRKESARRVHLYRSIFAITDEAGISDQSDRIELAKAILKLGEGMTSFTELSIDELEDVLFALRGWRVVTELRLANGMLETEARVLVQEASKIEGEIAAGKARAAENAGQSPAGAIS